METGASLLFRKSLLSFLVAGVSSSYPLPIIPLRPPGCFTFQLHVSSLTLLSTEQVSRIHGDRFRVSSPQAQTQANNSYSCDPEAQLSAAPSEPVKIVSIFGEGSISPLQSTPWQDVLLHTAERLKWIDEGFEMHVFPDDFIQTCETMASSIGKEIADADILLVVAVRSQKSVKWIKSHVENIPNAMCFESSPDLVNKLGGVLINTEIKGDMFGKLICFPESEKGKKENASRADCYRGLGTT